MRFDLRLTNRRRVRWLLGAWMAFLPLTLLLPALHLAWLLPPYYLALFVPLVFYSWLLRQPAWVQLGPDCITWANPADGPVVGCQFADLRAYRYDLSKNDSKLTLYPRDGEKVTLSGRLHKEFLTMQAAFEQAVRRYNQAHPGAEVAVEPSGLTKFFITPRATQVLWGLLALGVAGVGWGLGHQAPGVAYLPLVLVLVPYLLVWANFYYERP